MLDTVLSGRYRLLERIGEGGMAIVYRAEDTLLGRTVAVKVLRDDLAADPEFLERFRREAQAAAALTHPNIVNVYDVGQDTGRHYIVMEHVAGPTLKQVILQRGALPLAEALDIGAQVCAAAEVAHRRGIVHRDIKPQNILLAGDGAVKVADFGLAQPAAVAAGECGQETVLGTAHYMSPEQAQGRPATAASDTYAIGVVLYEMLTGRVPFDGATAEEVIQKHIGQAPVPPRQLNESLPAAVEGFVYKALAKDPDRRHATARELGNALAAYRALSDGQTVAVRPLQGPARPPETAPAAPSFPKGGQPQPAGPQPAAPLPAAAPRPTAAASQAAASAPRRPAPAPAPRRSEGVDWILALLVLITLSCVAGLAPLAITVRAALLPPAPTPAPTVTVPNLVGRPVADAESQLRGLGLSLVREGERFDDKVPAGRVLAQTIPSGSGLTVGSGVGVVLSKGAERIEAPGVTGLPASDAMNRLTVAGFVAVRDEAPSRTVPAGLVISQNPPALSQLARGATVTVTVSIGNKIQLPDLMGVPEDQAQDTLRSLGLNTTYVNYQRAEDIPESERWRLDKVAPGSVISQTPKPGTTVDPGTTVYLAVRSR